MIFEKATIIIMNPRRQIVEHGTIAEAEKAIIALGNSKEMVEKYPEKRRINSNLMPGLIDTHVHTAQMM